jgi:hypothetical protein
MSSILLLLLLLEICSRESRQTEVRQAGGQADTGRSEAAGNEDAAESIISLLSRLLQSLPSSSSSSIPEG